MLKVMTVFGIRPDFIRASSIIKKLKARDDVELCFVYTGQHYDKQLKSVFFEELNIPEPDISLNAIGKTHSEQHSSLISQLEGPIDSFKPDVCVFLGDANAVMGCVTPLKKGIPIAHVEAGMRSFDWDMPEEKNRVIIDRVSDVLYCYHENYKINLVREGINPEKCLVVGNTIVDVLDEYKDNIANAAGVLEKHGLKQNEYAVMTMHRDRHMSNKSDAKQILNKIAAWTQKNGLKVVWPMMPRAEELGVDESVLKNFVFTKPLGFFEFVALETCAAIEFTDSGTNQEVTSLVGTPCVVIRRATERPETFLSGISVLTEQHIEQAADWVIKQTKNDGFSLGNGNASEMIVNDLITRTKNNYWNNQFGAIDPFIAAHYAV